METHNLLAILRVARQETRSIWRKGHWKDLKYNNKLETHLNRAEGQIRNAIEDLEELELAEQLESVEKEKQK